MPDKRKSRYFLNSTQTWWFYTGVIFLFLAFASLHLSHSVRSDESRHLTEIIIIHSWIAIGIAWSSFLVAVSLILLACGSIFRPIQPYPAVGMVLAVLLYPFCFVVHHFQNAGPWTLYGEVTTEDNTRYAFCDSSFLQGQIMVIAKVARTNLFSRTYHVLVDNNGDSPRSWASVIRPANAPETYGQLYLAPGNVLVGVRYHNHCYLAYDLTRQVAIGHGDIEQVSPFICLDANTPINSKDIGRTLQAIQEQSDYCKRDHDIRHAADFLNGEPFPGCPSIATLNEGLQNPNPDVRDAAQAILARYTATKAVLAPRVQSHVADQIARLGSANAGDRRAASEALGWLGHAAHNAIPLLQQTVQNDNDSSVQLQAAQTLGLIGDDAIPALLTLALSDVASVREHALFGLRAARSTVKHPEIAEFLRTKLDVTSSEFRSEAARMLESLNHSVGG